MKFPYGICDFHKIITEGYVYIDRTDRIPLLEEAGSQLLFLRPRRFGKTLLLSMLENYYDVALANKFDELFGHLAIGQHPTPKHNQYVVLKWDFSLVDPQGDVRAIRQALHDHVNSSLQTFARRYQDVLPYPVEIDRRNAVYSLESALAAVQSSAYKLYLLIDEYDNFANEVMMGNRPLRKARYEDLLYSEGALKTLFKAVKALSAGRGVDRVFITGVSPVVLSDITSGYNIAESIYLRPEFNDLCGFGESEIADTLHQIVQDLSAEKATEALTMMQTFYNGYCFAYNKETFVYNPTLALYFMKEFQLKGRYPEEMLDENLAMDRGKITYISQLPQGEQLILDTLNEASPLCIQRLAHRFGVEDMLTAAKDNTFMASLLYFFGVLTFGGQTELRKLILKIPNLVVRKLYVERIQEMFLPDFRSDEVAQICETFYLSGNLQPLCDFIEQRYFKVFDNRDYRWTNELTIKTVFLTLLFNDLYYIIDSEPSLDRGYADLIMILRPDMRQSRLLDILIEFKYVSLKDAKLSGEAIRQLSMDELKGFAPVQQKLREAQAKLNGYRQTLASTYGDTLRLHAYSVVALGFERVVWVEV